MAYLYLKYIETGIPLLFHGPLCLIAYVFWIFLAIVMAPFMAVYRFVKLFEKALISYHNLGTVFSTLDVPFLHENESNRNFIIGSVEMSGKPNIEKIRRAVLDRFCNGKLDETYQRLRQRVSHHYLSYIWKPEENFNIKQHVPIYKGPIPETKEDIESLICKLADDPFPSNISPWRIIVIPKNNPDEFVLFFKFHHVIGDGFAMIGLLSRLVDGKPEFIKPSKKRKTFTSNPIKRAVGAVLTGPLALLTVMLSSNFLYPFKSKSTPRRKAIGWTEPISLDLVKKIKDLTGTTVNDVLMSCLAGAFRHYLDEVKEKPTDLPIAITFNSRQNLDKIKDNIPLGNHSGGVLLSLPVSIADPLKRVEKTALRMNKLKNLSHPHVFSFIYFNVIGCLPEYFGRISTFSLKKHVAMLCSNVPGPTDKLTLTGNPIKSIIFTPPLHADVGLSVSIFSYCGDIKLTLLSDADTVERPSRIAYLFEREVEKLAEHLLIE